MREDTDYASVKNKANLPCRGMVGTAHPTRMASRRHYEQEPLCETKPICGGRVVRNKANSQRAAGRMVDTADPAKRRTNDAKQTQFRGGMLCETKPNLGGVERDIPGAGWMARSAGQGKCGGAAPGNGVQHRVEWRGGGPEKTLPHPITWATIRPIGGT